MGGRFRFPAPFHGQFPRLQLVYTSFPAASTPRAIPTGHAFNAVSPVLHSLVVAKCAAAKPHNVRWNAQVPIVRSWHTGAVLRQTPFEWRRVARGEDDDDCGVDGLWEGRRHWEPDADSSEKCR